MPRPCRNYADTCPHAAHRGLSGNADPDRQQNHAAALAERASAAAASAMNPPQRLPLHGEARRLPPDVEHDLLRLAMDDLSVTRDQAVKDYWLHAALHRLSSRGIGIGSSIRQPRSRIARMLRRRPRIDEFDVLFAGGTALVSQWGLSARFSEDIDLLIVDRSDGFSRSSALRMSEALAVTCADAITDTPRDEWAPRVEWPRPIGARGFGVRAGDTGYAMIDVAHAPAEISPWTLRTATSIMGRYASPDQLQERPELGGFSFPSLDFAVTVGNKMHATVDNAERGRLAQLAARARDLFDVVSVASSADGRKAIIDHLHVCAIQAGARNDTVGQRAAATLRYPDSPALTAGAPEHEAVRVGYAHVIDELAWHPSTAPSFADAVEIARSLRLD